MLGRRLRDARVLLVLLVSLLTGRSHAQDAGDDAAPPRISAQFLAGLGHARRVVDAASEPLLFYGVEGAVVFGGVHGVRFGAFNSSIFGWLLPVASITTFDLAYSAQINTSRRLGEGPGPNRTTGSFGLVVGPSLALLHCDDVTNDQTLFGVRVGAFVDVHIPYFTLGMDGTFRAGLPIAGFASANWMVSAGIHLGITFEIPTRTVVVRRSSAS